MGIARHTTSVTLSTGTATPSGDTAVVVGAPVWIVAWTMVEHGRERQFTHPHYTEVGARRHVRNLIADRTPGLTETDVYTDNT